MRARLDEEAAERQRLQLEARRANAARRKEEEARAEQERAESRRKEAEELAAKLLQNVSKNDYHKKNAGSISGGQKQRLAFIQAMISPHEVLFGDEPTGNLDWGNAKKVMTTLREHIKANQKTGLVVSHDVPLSVAFADRIVLLTAKEITKSEVKTGVILPENVFTRNAEQWTSSERQLSNDEMTAFLKSHFEQHAS